MFEEVLMIVGLLLAAYGLASVLSAVVLWFTAPIKGKPYLLLVQLSPDEPVVPAIQSAANRLNNTGLHRAAGVIALDCGLREGQRQEAQTYCKSAGIPLFNLLELQNYLEKSSLQTGENTV